MPFKKIVNRFFSSKPSSVERESSLDKNLITLLGFQPRNEQLYIKALSHPTFNLHDQQGRPFNYERLEFLGDSVLSLVISEYLFKKLKNVDEGKLSEYRSKIVSRKSLNQIGKNLKLIHFLPRKNRKQYGENIEGNILEAIIGAIYLDQGYQAAKDFIYNKIIKPYVKLEKIENTISSYKNEIVEWTQKNKKQYKFHHRLETHKNGQDVHFVELNIDGKIMGKGRASSKKKAEEMAAKNAWRSLKE